MKRLGKYLMAMAVMAVTIRGGAATLTWAGGVTTVGDFTSAANWSPQQVPQPGDTLIVNDAVTFAATTFDVGTAGLTIQNAAKVKVISNVAFSGSGDITIHSKATDWQGGFFQKAACPSYSGDWYVYDGVFEPQVSSLGSGVVYVKSGDSNATLQIGNLTFRNNIQIVGAGKAKALNFTNGGRLTGVLSSDADFMINVAYASGAAIVDRLIAPDRTVTFTYNDNYTLQLTGKVEGNLVKKGKRGTLSIADSADLAEASLSIEEGTVAISRPHAVAALTVNGAAVENGFHRVDETPESVTGTGLFVVGGRVATWIGGATGAWSDGSNWTTGEAPMGTTIAKFTNAVELAAETVDFGDEGVCIWNVINANLVQNTSFTGTGMYCKYGVGEITYKVESSYTGGTLFTDGLAKLAASRVFGTGLVELTRSAAGNRPYVECGTWNLVQPNTFKLVGSISQERFRISNNLRLTGDIESDSDFTILSAWGPMWANGNFSAPGRTITFSEKDEGHNYVSYIAGAIDASLVKAESGFLELRGQSTVETNTLTVAGGKLALTAAATWGGPVALKSGALLRLNGNANLSTEAALTVEEGGKIEIANGVKIQVRSLTIGEKPCAAGIYSARTLPDLITGGGRLVVGRGGLVITIR